MNNVVSIRETEYQRVARLALTFPTILDKFEGGNAIGIDPNHPRGFDANLFHRFFNGPAGTSGSRHAARFILGVFNHYDARRWRIGVFSVIDAMGAWDNEHRNAFLAWARDPWWA